MSVAPSAFRVAVLWVLLAVITCGILLVGLAPRGFEFRNGAEWSDQGPGIGFTEPGLAYTKLFSSQSWDQPSQPELTLELVLRPNEDADAGFRFIAVVHSGNDQSQLLVAQFRQTIIVMNGDDYDYSRRAPRLAARLTTQAGEPFFLAATSHEQGSTLYINGHPVDSNADQTLRLPTDSEPGRLVLGNSVYGDSPWLGEVRGFALHRVALDEETIRRHHDLWMGDVAPAGVGLAPAEIFYHFSGGTGRTAVDESLNGIDLLFPRDTAFVAPKFFAGGTAALTLDNTADVVLNLVGFVPLGFVLFALLRTRTRMAHSAAFATACVIGLTLSFGVELAQAWIPSRSSSYLDLLLNVAGTGVGAAVYTPLSRAWQRAATRSSRTSTGL